MNITKKGAILLSSLGLIAGMAGTVALQTHAATSSDESATTTSDNAKKFTPPAAMGSVTAISGNTITITDKKSGTVYTVDASGAVVEKMPTETSGSSSSTTRPTPTTISVSGISIGDNVMVEGTVSGTSITATRIMDGLMGGGHGDHMGQPGTTGTVASVSGNTITLTGTDGKTYTVEAGSATLKKLSTISVSDIQAGDTLMVNGTTSGTTITAKDVMDGALPQKPAGSAPSDAK